MTEKVEDLIERALALPYEDRAWLLEAILQSLREEPAEGMTAEEATAWVKKVIEDA